MNEQKPLNPSHTLIKIPFRQVEVKNNQPPHMLFQGRWTPGPDAAEIALLSKKQYTAVIVWRAMLRDAIHQPDRNTSLSLSAIGAETRLSKPTIIRAQGQLLQAGYITRETGGGTSRKPTTFIMAMPKSTAKW
jgi:hypothetical protein